MGGGGGGGKKIEMWWQCWWRENNRNVVAVVVVVLEEKEQKCGGNGLYSFTIYQAVLEKKKVECRVDVGSMQGRCGVGVVVDGKYI